MSISPLQLKSFLDKRNLFFIIPLLALWAVPMIRAVRYTNVAWNVYAGEQSLNAWNDLHYGYVLFSTYQFCFWAEIVLCWVLARKVPLILLLLLLFPIWLTVQIIRYNPEEVIVLIPSINIWTPIKWNALALLIGLAVFARQRRKEFNLGIR